MIRDVHTEHCCKEHGCKYGSPDCTVTTSKGKQSYPCEECEYDQEEAQYSLNELKTRAQRATEQIDQILPKGVRRVSSLQVTLDLSSDGFWSAAFSYQQSRRRTSQVFRTTGQYNRSKKAIEGIVEELRFSVEHNVF